MDPENDDDHQYMKNNLISLTTHNDSNTSCNVHSHPNRISLYYKQLKLNERVRINYFPSGTIVFNN